MNSLALKSRLTKDIKLPMSGGILDDRKLVDRSNVSNEGKTKFVPVTGPLSEFEASLSSSRRSRKERFGISPSRLVFDRSNISEKLQEGAERQVSDCL